MHPQMKLGKTCKIEGCGKGLLDRNESGYCWRHWNKGIYIERQNGNFHERIKKYYKEKYTYRMYCEYPHSNKEYEHFFGKQEVYNLEDWINMMIIKEHSVHHNDLTK